MADETGRLLWTSQVMSLFWGVQVLSSLGWP
jgi:hypothetical protein